MFLQHVGWLATDCTALYCRGQNSSVVANVQHNSHIAVPWSRILFQKLTVPQLVREFHDLYGS
jgi:hypothetical protein